MNTELDKSLLNQIRKWTNHLESRGKNIYFVVLNIGTHGTRVRFLTTQETHTFFCDYMYIHSDPID